jgi:hypothetical protein
MPFLSSDPGSEAIEQPRDNDVENSTSFVDTSRYRYTARNRCNLWFVSSAESGRKASDSASHSFPPCGSHRGVENAWRTTLANGGDLHVGGISGPVVRWRLPSVSRLAASWQRPGASIKGIWIRPQFFVSVASKGLRGLYNYRSGAGFLRMCRGCFAGVRI